MELLSFFDKNLPNFSGFTILEVGGLMGIIFFTSPGNLDTKHFHSIIRVLETSKLRILLKRPEFRLRFLSGICLRITPIFQNSTLFIRWDL